MTPDDPGRTVPRTPPAPEQTADHVPADDTDSRAAGGSSADPNRTAPRPPSDTPGDGGTVVRSPSDSATKLSPPSTTWACAKPENTSRKW